METLRLKTGHLHPWITVDSRSTTTIAPSSSSQFTVAASSHSQSPASTPSISVDRTGVISRFPFNFPLRSLFNGGRQNTIKGTALDDAVLERQETGRRGGEKEDEEDVNWVMKILHVRSIWEKEQSSGENGDAEVEGFEGREKGQKGQLGRQGIEEKVSSSSSISGSMMSGLKCEGCECDGEDEELMEFDKERFGKLLRKVALVEVKLYAQLCHLGNLAYSIPTIKPGYLLKRHGLRFLTSSIEKREQLVMASSQKEEPMSSTETVKQTAGSGDAEVEPVGTVESRDHKNEGRQISASAAFQITASAAGYLYSQTRSILPFGSSSDVSGQVNDNAKMASLKATTESVTAVVAAEEDVKQAFADDLNSINSSPCEWFICDDDRSATRFFVIQGSETLASWQANLLFEPVLFEGTDVFVHRGIYEAAKGMYQQMLPEVLAHMKCCGTRAKFRFTGHSLGGSLSLLLNLMLLIRGEVPPSSLLPVITFGAPCIMCGGDDLLRKLGLPKSHVQSITMHRDIVPRAFSCTYPNHVAELLKAVNGNFRNHPCLQSQKLLYAPMGEFLILQPDASFSPPHDLLPSGSGLYLLRCSVEDAKEAQKLIRGAKNVFLNTPHPLEILSDRSAYGNGGMIQRDHDMNSYLKSVRGVIRQELSRIRKAKREHRQKFWWPIMVPHVADTGVIVGSNYVNNGLLNVGVIMRTGSESLKQLSRFVVSQRLHLLLVFLLPARWLFVGAFRMIG